MTILTFKLSIIMSSVRDIVVTTKKVVSVVRDTFPTLITGYVFCHRVIRGKENTLRLTSKKIARVRGGNDESLLEINGSA